MTAESGKPVIRVLNGEIRKVPPIWLMRQAGRYLPEYRDLRVRAGSFLDLCFNTEFAAEVTLQPIRRFGLDAAILFADILLVPHGLGQKLWFEEGEGPRLEPVISAADLAKLRVETVLDRTAPVFETVRRVRSALPRDVTLIGFAGAPWTVATYMIAGRGTPDQAQAKLLAYREPKLVTDLMALLVDSTVEYLSAQIEAGAEVVQLFDTWAGGLGGELFERVVLEPTAELVKALSARHPNIPIIGFPRGIGTNLGRYLEETGITAISIGTGENVAFLNRTLDPRIILQGGLDPLVLVAGRNVLERAVVSLLRQVAGRPYIFNLGHGILPTTPPEHVSRLVDLVRGEAR